MRNNSVTMTIADYCQAFDRNEVLINKSYQRSPQIWPAQARSFLIETILKGFPLPKLALHQITDLKSKRTIKHIVDGQQRSSAIMDFFNGKLRMSRTVEMEEAAGKVYNQLDPELQESFLAFTLQFDQFEQATESDVREYFRRINSFTAPLNAEEQRHAKFQGPMKWFVNSLSGAYGSVFVDLDVLSPKSVIRMADSKLISEIISALMNGITTTTKVSLNSMYNQYERKESLEDEAAMRAAIVGALDLILSFPEIRGTALMRMNVFYSLTLAATVVQSYWGELRYLAPTLARPILNSNAEQNLLTLAAALDDPEDYPELSEFTSAAGEKTNVKGQREERVRWLIRALSEDNFNELPV